MSEGEFKTRIKQDTAPLRIGKVRDTIKLKDALEIVDEAKQDFPKPKCIEDEKAQNVDWKKLALDRRDWFEKWLGGAEQNK